MKFFPSKERMWLTIVVLVILLSANALMGFVLVTQSQSTMREIQETRMLDVAKAASVVLDGDTLKSLKADDKGTEAYKKVYDTLAMFRDNIKLDYIYCVKGRTTGKDFVFTVDSDPVAPGEFGSPVPYTDALYKASTGTAAVDREPYTDAWGRFYSAYSPVFDSNGQVAGIVAVDFQAQWYEDQISSQTHAIYMCTAFSIGLCLLLLFMATTPLRRKVQNMQQNLGDLAHDLDELTWEMSDMGGSGEHKASVPDTDSGSTFDDINERIQAIKAGLRRYWEDNNSKAHIITSALAADYRDIYYWNLDTDQGICYKALGGDCGLEPGQTFYFTPKMKEYAAAFLPEAEREAFLKFMHPREIREALMETGIITYLCKVERGGETVCAEIQVAAIKHADNLKGHGIHAVGVGIKDVYCCRLNKTI